MLQRLRTTIVESSD